MQAERKKTYSPAILFGLVAFFTALAYLFWLGSSSLIGFALAVACWVAAIGCVGGLAKHRKRLLCVVCAIIVTLGICRPLLLQSKQSVRITVESAENAKELSLLDWGRILLIWPGKINDELVRVELSSEDGRQYIVYCDSAEYFATVPDTGAVEGRKFKTIYYALGNFGIGGYFLPEYWT